ncbi:alpha/beta fold hydrolase [Mesorhizobium sp. LHD-90]|uniref:alpha/beta fold hydrolase n=1 Tax=Mesorhizobium sp. LHD-90 TaxID=3071414 RepID=UPI0027E1C7EE|nr:alpha/beta fold hydrolase [Mesorhizobium sp. LHD-90]MDQ6437891.1 alpha/beta fold hydrolase [Mesorhizobium sp. LHD-90]
MASLGWQVTRTLFGIGERVAPKLAGRAAFELFARTPNPRIQTDGERKAIARAADFMSTARHHRLSAGKDCVAVHEFRPDSGSGEAGRALVVHGWRSRTEYMRALVEGLRAAGYRVFAVDLPGHGQSAGRRLTIMKGVDALANVAQWFGPFDVVLGHSFGGAVAVNAVAGSLAGTTLLCARRLVLIAAPNSISEILDGFGRQIGLGRRSRDAMAERIERIAKRRLDDFAGSRQLARVAIPTLVVHAPDDREVPADDARTYAGAGPHVTLHWAPGLGHRRILADTGVVARTVSFAKAATPLAKVV